MLIPKFMLPEEVKLHRVNTLKHSRRDTKTISNIGHDNSDRHQKAKSASFR